MHANIQTNKHIQIYIRHTDIHTYTHVHYLLTLLAYLLTDLLTQYITFAYITLRLHSLHIRTDVQTFSLSCMLTYAYALTYAGKHLLPTKLTKQLTTDGCENLNIIPDLKRKAQAPFAAYSQAAWRYSGTETGMGRI